MVAEIVSEMEYLRSREQTLRDTNESTNTRVKWFAFATMGMLVALGVWQIVYLRAYFRYVVHPLAVVSDSNISSGQSISFRPSDGYVAKVLVDGAVAWWAVTAVDQWIILCYCRCRA
jgi:hypothetical protein